MGWVIFMDYIDTYASWYPTSYNVGTYPRSVNKPKYTATERDKIYKSLTTAQQHVLDDYKKRQMSSKILEVSYMRSSKWEFVGYNIDPDFVQGKKAKFYCECKRPLKYQFVLQARKNPKEVRKLGISHFSDHLGIPEKVVREIYTGLTHVDMSFDELLWLKKRGTKFPSRLWQRYVYAHFNNNRLEKPCKMNHKLWLRMIDFKQADMPVFTADYESANREILTVNQRLHDEDLLSMTTAKETFEHYLMDVELNAKLDLFKFENFWSLTSQPFLTEWAKQHNVKPKQSYFQNLLHILQSEAPWQASWQSFPLKSGSKIIQPDVSKYLFNLSRRYHLTDSFFYEVPLFFRRGLREAIREQKQNKVVKKTHSETVQVIQSEPKIKQLKSEAPKFENLPNKFYHILAKSLLEHAVTKQISHAVGYFKTEFEKISIHFRYEPYLKQTIDFLAGDQGAFPIDDQLSQQLKPWIQNQMTTQKIFQQYEKRGEALKLYNQWHELKDGDKADVLNLFKQLALDDLSTDPISKPNDIFFDKLFNLLLKVNKLNVGQSKQSVLQLFKHYSIRELSLADKLLQSYAEFVQSTNYTKSFVNIREPFYSELNKRFRYLTTLE